MSTDKFSRITNKGLFILDKKTLGIQVVAPEDVTKEEALKSLNEEMDNDGHELYINMVNHVNELNGKEKELIVLETILAGFLAVVDIYNLNKIINNENPLGFFNYIISGVLTYGVMLVAKDIIKTIMNIIVRKPFLNSLNEYTKEHYPDEFENIKPGKTLRKIFKRKKNVERES